MKNVIKYVNNSDKTTIKAEFGLEGQGYHEMPDSIYQEMLLIEHMDQGDTESIRRALDYTTNQEKTIELVTGVNCTSATAYAEMICVKTMFNKLQGRQFVHFVQSFHPAEQVTPQQVHEIGIRLAKEFERFKGFQIVVATHVNEKHIHNHFVINSVNMETGLKWQQSPAQMKMVKDFSDQLCRSYGLSIIEHKESKRESTGEYRAKQRGQSWKYELRLTVDACMKNSVDRANFISNMRKLGYDVKWTDTRKDITFYTPDGKKCRNSRLDKELTKEALIMAFKLNQELKDPKEMAEEIRKLELTAQVAKAGMPEEDVLMEQEISSINTELEEEPIENSPEELELEVYFSEDDREYDDVDQVKRRDQEWKHELRLAVDKCMKTAVGRADFIVNMRKLGYEVIWTDTRKYITFITPNGKRCRNSNLDIELTKEALTDAFKLNRTIKDKGQMQSQVSDDRDNTSNNYCVKWSDRYKEARAYLYGKDEVKQDFTKAYQLFVEEAQNGNALAMYDLGRMYADGLGVEINHNLAQEWYSKAFVAFNTVESKGSKPYTQYRIGKMYAAGLGTQQDFEKAVNWFKRAVEKNHKYAQYSLAGMYYRGQGVEQHYEVAFNLYKKSADQNNPYASYELAKMLRDGLGSSKDIMEADKYFKHAFIGFSMLEKENSDDKLQYRLGQMLYSGTGIEKNIPKAIEYLEMSANTGNVNAQYLLAKVLLETENGLSHNVKKALTLLERAAAGGNAQAQYTLANILVAGQHIEKDITRAMELYTASAEQKNGYAAYALGKLYLAGTEIPKDTTAAVKWLTISADLGNSFAQYYLAKLYLEGEEIQADVPKGIELLNQSAKQQNQYAQYMLGKTYLLGDKVSKDIDLALKWLTASANLNNQFAQYRLGNLYIEGNDVPKNVELGLKLIQDSAGQGNSFAQFKLGTIYLSGKDVPRNKELARYYFTLSAEQGNELAQLILDKMDSYNMARMDILIELMNLFSDEDHEKNKSRRYPLSRLEGHALKEKILELQFASSMKWDKGNGYER